MWDIATPITIGNTHIGNLFLGQFFFDDEEIDKELFRKQAQTYGFDEDAYIRALEKVPGGVIRRLIMSCTFTPGLYT